MSTHDTATSPRELKNEHPDEEDLRRYLVARWPLINVPHVSAQKMVVLDELFSLIANKD